MAAKKGGYRVAERRDESPNVVEVEIDVPSAYASWEQWFLLQSDEHFDNPKCDLDLLRRHHDEAVQRDAGILKFGDTFCAMQGKYDKRASKDDLREEHRHGNYLDRLVSTAADFYEPYADRIIQFGDGNHETAIYSRHETDLLERLCATLTDRSGSPVRHTGYTGWVWFKFKRGNNRRSRRLWYTHGYGGGGPVTKDAIQFHRQNVYVDNADIIASGHTHDAWTIEQTRIRLSDSGRVERRTVHGVKLGTYKDDYGDGQHGWAIGKGHPPKPMGAQWLRFTWSRKTDEPLVTVVRTEQ